MDTSGYTLLIVESSIIAKRIQDLSPTNIYVIGTDGFIWHPNYDSQTSTLRKKADPEKLTLRKELKSQSQIASRIVIAADSDPAGDFITWTISRYLKNENIERGLLQSVTKPGIRQLLNTASPISDERLHYRLENRYRIQQAWYKHLHKITPDQAGLAALFGAKHTFRTFSDEAGQLFHSVEPIHCEPSEPIELTPAENSKIYPLPEPLSTFSLVPLARIKLNRNSFEEAQNLINKLYQTADPNTGEGLITYPRTEAQAYYSYSWVHFENMILQLSEELTIRPNFLRNIAPDSSPHESIHPVNFQKRPGQIEKTIPSPLGDLYRTIYNRFIFSITVPNEGRQAFSSTKFDQQFFSTENQTDGITQIYPVHTISAAGHYLHNLGVTKPSSFGKWLDKALAKKWITIDENRLRPGEQIEPHLPNAENYKQLLTTIQAYADERDLDDETIDKIFTSITPTSE